MNHGGMIDILPEVLEDAVTPPGGAGRLNEIVFITPGYLPEP
jgi:hypothetical protein